MVGRTFAAERGQGRVALAAAPFARRLMLSYACPVPGASVDSSSATSSDSSIERSGEEGDASLADRFAEWRDDLRSSLGTDGDGGECLRSDRLVEALSIVNHTLIQSDTVLIFGR
jgi:hypothetical protein